MNPFRAEDVTLRTDFLDHAAVALGPDGAVENARHLTVLADRERIAHDLNDHVIQQIFAIGLDLQGTIARCRSSEITAGLNRSVTDLQGSSRTYAPPSSNCTSPARSGSAFHSGFGPQSPT